MMMMMMMVLSQIDEDDRTAIGVPLGLALLLLGLFSLTAVFICCLQWGYLGSLWDAPHQHDTNETHQYKSSPPQLKQSDKEVERLPVLMPGDELPRFIAMACPCQPPILETRIQVQI
ncbi:Uncharacterized protein At5g65660 [Linum grandiflorum]